MDRIRTLIATPAMTLGVLAGSSAALAEVEFSDPAIRITATNSQGTGELIVGLDDGIQLPDGSWIYAGFNIDILDDANNVVASLDLLNASFLVDNPTVSLNFVGTAGDDDTMLTFSSTLATFDTIDPAQLRASAGLTATDNDGDGVNIVGQQPGGGAFIAQYNGLVPDGTTFTELLPDDVGTGVAFGTDSDDDELGFLDTGEGVSSISSQWKFLLTANDAASGSSVFVVTPAPGAFVLLALGGAAATRRRR